MIDHRAEGRGPALVLLHPFATDQAFWEPQRADFGRSHRVVTPTLRGFHGSPATDGSPVSMDAYADDVVALMDALGLGRAVVGGLSLGGYVALSLALRHGERVAGLVLANTRATADSAEGAAHREVLAADVEARGAQAVVDSYGDRPFGPDCAAAAKDRVRGLIGRQPPAGLVSGLRGMAQRPDRSTRLGAIRVPTLVVAGSHDVYTPPADGLAIHRGIEGSRFVELRGAGHLSSVDSPQAFHAAVGEFLDGLPR